MQTIEALTAAAVALLQEASPEIVRRVLRELLDSDQALAGAAEPAVHGPANGAAIAASRVLAKAPSATRCRAKGKRPARRPAAPADPAWEQLRAELRAAMAARGADYATIASTIGMSEVTVRLNVCRSRPPGEALLARLREWLAAPAVAAEAAFLRRSAGNSAAAAA